MSHKPETLALHAGHQIDETGSRAVPIYQTTSYQFRDSEHAANLFALKELGNIYTRIMNPTNGVAEERIAALHGGSGALVHASGQAAITNAILNICEPGDNIISVSQLYGGTYNLFHYTLPKMGISVKFVDSSDVDGFRSAIDDRTRALFGETLGNPSLTMMPLEELAKVGAEAGVPLIVDNTSLSPALLKPIDFGANVVVESLTKFMGGHGLAIGGVVVDAGNFDWGNGRFRGFTDPDPSYHGLVHWDAFKEFPPAGGANVAYIFKMRLQYLRDTGGSASPFNSWLHLLGIETLPLRMERHSANALKVAEYLSKHPKVNWVNYPGLPDSPNHASTSKYLKNGYGALLGMGIEGGLEGGRRFIDSLKLFSHLANIGDAKSLAIHPASTTHSQLTEAEQVASGVSTDYVRLSVGIEHIDDLIADLDQALAS